MNELKIFDRENLKIACDNKMSHSNSIYEHIDKEKGFALTENDKLFVLSEFRDYVESLEEIGEYDDAKIYQEYYDKIKKNGVKANKKIIQEYAFSLSEAVMHEIYHYYNGFEETIRFIEKSLLGGNSYE